MVQALAGAPTGGSSSIRRRSADTALSRNSSSSTMAPASSGQVSLNARIQADHYDATRRIVYLSKQLQAAKRELNAVVEGNELTRRFNQLAEVGRGNTARASKLPINASKQRYRDIVAYDHTRVHLAAGSGERCN